MGLAAIRAALKAELEARKADTDALTALRSAAEAPNSTVTPAEITAAIAKRDAHDPLIDALVEQERAAVAEEARDNAMSELMNRSVPNSGAQPQARVAPATGLTTSAGDGVQREPRTYSEQRNISGDKASFFQDAYRSQMRNDPNATERLARHAREVEIEQREQFDRATATGAYAGLVVPQYLTDLVAPVLRFGRPTANAINRHQLPGRGMQLIIPRGTTGATVASQNGENTALSNTDEVVANLTVPVITIGGQQDVSRQALERGEMIDQYVYGDLARAYAAELDRQVITGSGTAGQHLGMVNTAGISAATAFGTPVIDNTALSAARINTKIAGQIAAVTGVGAGLFPKLIIMNPRRWGYFTGVYDSTGRPFVTSNALDYFNMSAIITQPGEVSADPDPVTGLTFVGTHSSGLPIVSDLNVPTTVGTASEDLILVIDPVEHHLWEEGSGAPTELRFEQTTGGSLTTKLVVYGYSAYTAGRYPGATGKVGGVDASTFGLVAPTF